ncbi:MAG: hypothetical protein SF028_09575 [Candidatus Sumerlaeia bacterium]|nr:hypothetical protein [Candidatus Sumerlaeia bacterium]
MNAGWPLDLQRATARIPFPPIREAVAGLGEVAAWKAAFFFSEWDDPDTCAELATALASADQSVAAIAAHLLKHHGDDAAEHLARRWADADTAGKLALFHHLATDPALAARILAVEAREAREAAELLRLGWEAARPGSETPLPEFLRRLEGRPDPGVLAEVVSLLGARNLRKEPDESLALLHQAVARWLESADDRVRAAALRLCGNQWLMGRHVEDRIAAALRDPSREVVDAALLAAGAAPRGHGAFVAPLLEIARAAAGDPRQRQQALRALTRLRTNDADVLRAALDACSAEDTEVAKEAGSLAASFGLAHLPLIEAAMAQGRPRARFIAASLWIERRSDTGAVRAALADPAKRLAVLEALEQPGLARLEYLPDLEAVLTEASSTPAEAEAAVVGLLALGVPGVRVVLRALLQGADPRAPLVLKHLDDSHLPIAELVAVLESLSESPDAAARVAAVEAPRGYRHHSTALVAVVAKGLKDPDPKVRREAFRTLALLNKSTDDALREVAEQLSRPGMDPTAALWGRLLLARAGRADPAWCAQAVAALGSDDEEMATAALRLLQVAGEDAMALEPKLRGWLADAHRPAAMRARAAQALAQVAPDHSPALAALLQHLDDPAPQLRAACRQALAEARERLRQLQFH